MSTMWQSFNYRRVLSILLIIILLALTACSASKSNYTNITETGNNPLYAEKLLAAFDCSNDQIYSDFGWNKTDESEYFCFSEAKISYCGADFELMTIFGREQHELKTYLYAAIIEGDPESAAEKTADVLEEVFSKACAQYGDPVRSESSYNPVNDLYWVENRAAQILEMQEGKVFNFWDITPENEEEGMHTCMAVEVIPWYDGYVHNPKTPFAGDNGEGEFQGFMIRIKYGRTELKGFYDF